MGVKIKPIQVKPEKQSQAQGNPSDLKFSLIIGHDYTVSEYILPTSISFTPLAFFPPTIGQAFVAPLGNMSNAFPLHNS